MRAAHLSAKVLCALPSAPGNITDISFLKLVLPWQGTSTVGAKHTLTPRALTYRHDDIVTYKQWQ